MKEQAYRVFKDRGYVIVDKAERRIHFHTFSGNRKDAWDKFTLPEMRAAWKKNGMECVYVELSGGFWFTPLPEDVLI